MNDDLELELRNALRRKHPSRDLMPAIPRPERNWWRLGIAAMLALAVGGGAYRVNEERRAKDQLVFALRLTAVKLKHTRAQMDAIQVDKHL